MHNELNNMNEESVRAANRPSPERNRLAFFVGFLREPQQVGSLVPSSRHLECRIIEAAELSEARLVVEMGPGTGGTTLAILRQLRPDAKVLTIEMSQHFVNLLNDIEDPRLINHNGNAEHLPEILAKHGLTSPDVVISGIPFSTMPVETGQNIVRAIRDNLADDGRFVAYQFRSDVSDITTPIMGLPSFSTVMRNIPPMRVYRWRKVG
jgi:phospholipid N-methyltransferase